MDIKERNKQVKSILSKLFGFKNVSVRGGRGTATGWCQVNITTSRPKDCECNPLEPWANCKPCKDHYRTISDKAENALNDVAFYHYTDDMNYSHRELIVQVKFA